MEFLRSLTPEEKAAKAYDWTGFIARDSQLPPLGDWDYWLICAGRGFGKTRCGAETVRQWIKDGRNYVNLIGATTDDVLSIMIEGESGIMAVCSNAERPRLNGNKRRLEWPNGARTMYYSAEEPKRLRGPQHQALWCDEIAAWRYSEAWDMALFGLRLGAHPQAVITTTPRPIPIIKQFIADPRCHVTTGSTYDNSENLAATFIHKVVKKFEGTRLGRQELNAEVLDDVPGALWTRAGIDAGRLSAAPEMQRIVVAVDPSGTSGKADNKNDDVGIVVAGLTIEGRGAVLADRTCNLSPAQWGARAISAYHEFAASAIVVETNFGGAMVEAIIRSIDPNVPVRCMTASRGKVARAEPVAALYEQGRVSHVGTFGALEDQMCCFATNGYEGGGSPDRADALVWAITDLMLNEMNGQAFLTMMATDKIAAEAKAAKLASRVEIPQYAPGSVEWAQASLG